MTAEEARLYLKALELYGFKSFADKTVLTFGKNITAVVGPNGAGKSNLSDAILWVMGEQRTRTLRGSKMEDVIFGGTETRNPLGYAQVTLILDNEDGSLPLEAPEVQLSRRYYRSGESEYYINRRQVRLRDVEDLLMDTGLGRDGYRRRASRATATARKMPSGNWGKQRRISFASTIKSRNWNCRSARCGSRRRRRDPIWISGHS